MVDFRILKEENEMIRRFKVETIIENGMGHYKITDQKTGKIIHCDFGELNSILYELMEE
mgnify:CR=1 FL=1